RYLGLHTLAITWSISLFLFFGLKWLCMIPQLAYSQFSQQTLYSDIHTRACHKEGHARGLPLLPIHRTYGFLRRSLYTIYTALRPAECGTSFSLNLTRPQPPRSRHTNLR